MHLFILFAVAFTTIVYGQPQPKPAAQNAGNPTAAAPPNTLSFSWNKLYPNAKVYYARPVKGQQQQQDGTRGGRNYPSNPPRGRGWPPQTQTSTSPSAPELLEFSSGLLRNTTTGRKKKQKKPHRHSLKHRAHGHFSKPHGPSHKPKGVVVVDDANAASPSYPKSSSSSSSEEGVGGGGDYFPPYHGPHHLIPGWERPHGLQHTLGEGSGEEEDKQSSSSSSEEGGPEPLDLLGGGRGRDSSSRGRMAMGIKKLHRAKKRPTKAYQRAFPLKAAPPQSSSSSSSEERDNYKEWSKVEYEAYPGQLHDISNLIPEAAYSNRTIICVVGVFVVYPQPYYQAENVMDIDLVGGISRCQRGGRVESIQLVSSYGSLSVPTLTPFPFEYFQGSGLPLHTSLNHISQVFPSTPQSLVISSSTPWAVRTTDNTTTYCLLPTYNQNFIKFPICFLTSFNSTPLVRGPQWMSVKPLPLGCPGGSLILPVSECFDLLDELESTPASRNSTEEDGPSVFESVVEEHHPPPPEPDLPPLGECGKNEEFLQLLDIRMNNNFGSDYQVRLPLDKAHSWRTAALDVATEIVLRHTCPSLQLLPPPHFLLWREMFLYFIERDVWAKGAGWPGRKREERVDGLGAMGRLEGGLQRCLSILEEDEEGKIQDAIEGAMREKSVAVGMLLGLEGLVEGRDEFQRNVRLDMTMELVWLMANQLYSACQFVVGHNFWLEFHPTFSKMYLEPMVKHWVEPGPRTGYYKSLFGGQHTPFTQVYETMARCTSDFADISHLETLERPKGVGPQKKGSNSTVTAAAAAVGDKATPPPVVGKKGGEAVEADAEAAT